LKVLFVFLDGVGIGDSDPDDNPFLRADLPVLRKLLDGRLPSLAAPVAVGDRAVAFPLDATLGTPGTPQSGTGQTALLTGVDAPRLFGRHFGPWVPVRLRRLVEEESVLRRARDAGHRVAFANAYPEGWPEPPTAPTGSSSRDGGGTASRDTDGAEPSPRRSRIRIAAPPLAARGAGVLDRHADALRSGHAVASEIVNDGWRTRLGIADLPSVTARDAGRTLARVGAEVDLCLYAHYATDVAGHRGGMHGAVRALERVDAFLGGVVDEASRETLLLVASDHGNIERVTAGHTRNPSLGLLVGEQARERARRLTSIRDVPEAVLEWLEE